MNKLNISNETKVGILASFAIAFLVIGYNFLAGKFTFTRSNEYYAVFDKVDGLTPSRPVKVNGFQIGRVSNLRLMPDGMVLVELRLDKDVEIPQNSIANLMSSDLLGNKMILIQFGNSKNLLHDGDTLKSEIAASLSETLKPLQVKVGSITEQLNQTLTALNNMMTPEFQHDFASMIKSMSKTAQNTEAISTQLRQMTESHNGKIYNTISNLESISSNLKNNNQNINSSLNNINKITTELSDAKLGETLKQTQKAVTELQAVLAKLNSSNGTLGSLVNDNKLYENLNNTSKSLNDLLVDLKAHPKRYVNFSLFGGGAHKKQQK